MVIVEIEICIFPELRSFIPPVTLAPPTAPRHAVRMSSIHSLARHAFPVLNESFLVDSTFEYVKELGQGAYGVVCAAKSKVTGESVAIKKVILLLSYLHGPGDSQRTATGHESIPQENPHEESAQGAQVRLRLHFSHLPLTYSPLLPGYSITLETTRTYVPRLGTSF